MQTPVTVVMLLHDIGYRNRPAGLQGAHGAAGWGDLPYPASRRPPQRVVHIRLPPAPGHRPYPQWARLTPAEKAAHWTLKRGSKLLCGAVRSLTEAEYAALEKTHICCTVADVSDNRGRPATAFSCGRELTPHVQAHFLTSPTA